MKKNIFEDFVNECVIDETGSFLLHKENDSYIFIPDSDCQEKIDSILDFCGYLCDEDSKESWLLIKINNNTIFNSLITEFDEASQERKNATRNQLINYKKDIEHQLKLIDELLLQ